MAENQLSDRFLQCLDMSAFVGPLTEVDISQNSFYHFEVFLDAVKKKGAHLSVIHVEGSFTQSDFFKHETDAYSIDPHLQIRGLPVKGALIGKAIQPKLFNYR